MTDYHLIYNAAKSKDIEKLKCIKQKIGTLDILMENGCTPAATLALEGNCSEADLLIEMGANANSVALVAARAKLISYCSRLLEQNKASLDSIVLGYAQGNHLLEAYSLLNRGGQLINNIGLGIGLSGAVESQKNIAPNDPNLVNWIVYGASRSGNYKLMELMILQHNAKITYCILGLKDKIKKPTRANFIDILANVHDVKLRALICNKFVVTKYTQEILTVANKMHHFINIFPVDTTTAYNYFANDSILYWFLQCNMLINLISREMFLLISAITLNLDKNKAESLYSHLTTHFYKQLLLKELGTYSKNLFSEHNKRAASFSKAISHLKSPDELKKQLHLQKQLLDAPPKKSLSFFKRENQSTKHLTPVKNPVKDSYYGIIEKSLSRFSRV